MARSSASRNGFSSPSGMTAVPSSIRLVRMAAAAMIATGDEMPYCRWRHRNQTLSKPSSSARSMVRMVSRCPSRGASPSNLPMVRKPNFRSGCPAVGIVSARIRRRATPAPSIRRRRALPGAGGRCDEGRPACPDVWCRAASTTSAASARADPTSAHPPRRSGAGSTRSVWRSTSTSRTFTRTTWPDRTTSCGSDTKRSDMAETWTSPSGAHPRRRRRRRRPRW